MVDVKALGENIAMEETPQLELAIAPEEQRVRIILEENDNIPPSGQFFGVQGKGYVLRPGEEADVPLSIIGILNTAVMSVPVMADQICAVRLKSSAGWP